MERRALILALLAITFFTGLNFPCQSQDNRKVKDKFSAALLKADFMILRDTLEAKHPGIYRYKTKKEIDHVFDSCLSEIKDSMTVVQFYPMVSFAIASMQDGHSNCKLSKETMDDFVSNSKVLPAMVLFIGARPYVYCCKQESALNGSEILSINGQPADEIVRRFFSYIPSDAGIASRKNWELPEYFHLLYSTLYGEQENFEIVVKSTDGVVKHAKLQSDIIKNIICNNPFPAPKKYLSLSYHEGGVALLTIKTFFDGFLERTGEHFDKFLDSAFIDIRKKKIKKLLIDIRRNQGGNDGNGALLYSYLSQKPFAYYSSIETVNEKFTAEKHSLLNEQLPQSNNFAGKVYVLQDGRSFSASAEFAAIAKSNQRAFFIGEENGGGYYGNTSGDDISLVLPNTKISCRVPLDMYSTAVKKLPNGAFGINADLVLYPKIEDIISGNDNELKKALKFVAEPEHSPAFVVSCYVHHQRANL